VSNIERAVGDGTWDNEPMADSSFYREKAEQALRLARDSTDPVLIKNLKDMAQEYIARADALDGVVLGKDPEDDE
jgi:hypothetical protein